MSTIDETGIVAPGVKRGRRMSFRRIRRLGARAIGMLFPPVDDPARLGQHLRRDAGLDAARLERVRAARAPLIR